MTIRRIDSGLFPTDVRFADAIMEITTTLRRGGSIAAIRDGVTVNHRGHTTNYRCLRGKDVAVLNALVTLYNSTDSSEQASAVIVLGSLHHTRLEPFWPLVRGLQANDARFQAMLLMYIAGLSDIENTLLEHDAFAVIEAAHSHLCYLENHGSESFQDALALLKSC